MICQTITLLFTVKGEQYFALCYPENRMLLQGVVCVVFAVSLLGVHAWQYFGKELRVGAVRREA